MRPAHGEFGQQHPQRNVADGNCSVGRRSRIRKAPVGERFIALFCFTLVILGATATCLGDPATNQPNPAISANPPQKQPSGKVKTDPSTGAETTPATRRTLSGAELYSIHCNRCHPERYPTERTAAQWKTILLHMRVRANLPAEQSRIILKYLQDNSGR